VDFFFKQCVYSLLVFISFFILYKPLPEKAAQEAQQENAKEGSLSGFSQILRAMYSQPQFSLQLVTHGLLGAVGFVVPSAVWFIFEDLGLSEDVGEATDIAFIGTGVAAGVFLGAFSTDGSSYRRILKVCYFLGAFSTVCCCVVAYSDVVKGRWTAVGIVALMAVAGFATLGFTGVAFEDLARFPGIRSSYVLWIGYVIMLSISATLNTFAAGGWGLLTLAATASGTCIVFIACCKESGSEKYAQFTEKKDIEGLDERTLSDRPAMNAKPIQLQHEGTDASAEFPAPTTLGRASL
jgi:hypothetical protein